MSINATAEITELTIDHDVFSSLEVSIVDGYSDDVVVKINDLTIKIADSVALELLHSLAKHYDYKLTDI